jgi:hypothetical protein
MNYDYLLKFTDESQANSVLFTKVPTAWEDPVNPEDPPVPTEWQTVPNYDNIDTLGIIYEDQPIPDPENPPEPIPMDGWHVNVRNYTEADELLQYTVHPVVPRRVWAGYNPPPMETGESE